MRVALELEAAGRWYDTAGAPGSSLQVTTRRSARSHQRFSTMPWVRGSVPVAIEVWPAHVIVLQYGYSALVNCVPCSSRVRKPRCHRDANVVR